MLEELDHPFSQKMEIVTYYLTKPQYSYNQASISFFVTHIPQMLAVSVLMVLFESLGHVSDLQYVNAIILAFSGSPRLAQTCNFRVFCN